MPYDKRRWVRLSATERRVCDTPGCEVLAKERCARGGCEQMHCLEHKGSHTAIHTLMKQRAAAEAPPRPTQFRRR